jgi:phenylalanyl-tRNA synthetase beta chain
MVDLAMSRVVGLLAQTADGDVAADTLSHYPDPVRPWHVPLRLARAELLLGMPVEAPEAAGRLRALGCEVEAGERELDATVPTFRRDLRREVDLVEEVGRLIGLDRVPEGLPGVPQPGGLTPDQRERRLLRRLLADLGLSEAITYPFGPRRWTEDLGTGNGEGAVGIKNPLSAENGELRASILPGLLDAAARNKTFGVRGGALFEVGRVFAPDAPPEALRRAAMEFRMTGRVDALGPDAEPNKSSLMGVREEERLGVVLAGTVRPAGWNAPAARAGFFEAKGLVERLVPGASFAPDAPPFLHPGRSAVVRVAGGEAGWVGELHPEVAEKFGLDGWPVAAFELDPGFCRPDVEPRFEPFVSVPAVARDLAVVVGRGVPVGEMLASVEGIGGLLAEVRVFDVYEGDQIPEGHKSVALGFVFQGERTLTDEEVDAEMARITAHLGERFGGRVRT